jgi:hypothetical protein
MSVVITWIKTYSAANDGEILTGQNLGDIQTAIENHSHTDSPASFLSLNDTPATYTGQAGLYVKVNVTETGLEFATVSGGAAYGRSFVDADLAAGVLTVNHALGVKYVVPAIYDSNEQMIIPDNVTAVNTVQCLIDLSSYSPIAGTWNLRICG